MMMDDRQWTTDAYLQVYYKLTIEPLDQVSKKSDTQKIAVIILKF